MPRLTTLATILAALAGPVFAHNDLLTSLPVEDGHVSTEARVGYVFTCARSFRGDGARHVGDWFHGNGWNPAQKPHVRGRVFWDEATFGVQVGETALTIMGNGLPVGQPTGTFPMARSDPASAYDTNPNAISATTLDFVIPRAPHRAAIPGCLGMGMIGITVTGVAIYNALDDSGRDAAAHEMQDLCDGHPMGRGQYHYHSASPCLPGVDGNELVGWALDGYPILGMHDASGRLLTNADLDACHGQAETVEASGLRYDYAYRLTQEYPYTLGCFTGQVAPGIMQQIRQGMGPRQNGPQRKQP